MPTVPSNILADGGLVTAPDRTTLQPGELRRALCEYRLGSSQAHKVPGRSRANSVALPSHILNLNALRYEAGTDVFVAAAGNGQIYEATPPGLTMTFGSAVLGSGARDTNAIPSFTHFNDRWGMVNGVDANLVREPNPINILSGHPAYPWNDGNWRDMGMTRPNIPPVLTVVTGTAQTAKLNTTPLSQSGNFWDTSTGNKNPASFASIADSNNSTACRNLLSLEGTSDSIVFTLTSTAFNAVTNRRLKIVHAAATSGEGITFSNFGGGGAGNEDFIQNNQYFKKPSGSDLIKGRLKIEVSVDAGVTYTTVVNQQAPYPTSIAYFDIDDAVTGLGNATPASAKLRVRFSGIVDDNKKPALVWLLTDLREMTLDNNLSGTTHTAEFPIQYGFTERYTDAEGVIYESALSDVVTIEPATFTNVNGVLVTIMPAEDRSNRHALQRIVYRSLDEEGGGFPNMYQVAELGINDVGWVDTLDLSLTSAADKTKALEMIPLVDPVTGFIIKVSPNNPPPSAVLALPFDGAMVYVSATERNRLYFSLPTANGPAAAEQVPAPYYFDFVTPRNDDIKTAALTNGGRTLVVYFEGYTMLVNFVPQGTDPGAFDNKVREYVSNSRGSMGVHTACTFSPDEAVSTLAASADLLGVWITDGVGLLKNWTKDIDWSGDDADGVPMPGNSDVDLTTAMLVDNPPMRRLELIYDSGEGVAGWHELHFYYGSMKENGQPRVTGPHPAGWRSKFYAVSGDLWRGWSGDATSAGYVFNERAQDADASNAVNTDGDVVFDIQTGDIYPYGLNQAGELIFLYPKFETGVTGKEVDISATFDRDGGPTNSYPFTKTKVFNTATGKKMWWGRAGDRFNIRIRDESNTALASFVGATYTARLLGGEGNK